MCSQIFGLGCFGASLLGVLLVARVVKRSGKASIVVFLLAMVIGVGAILTAIFGGRDAILVRGLPLRACGGCVKGQGVGSAHVTDHLAWVAASLLPWHSLFISTPFPPLWQLNLPGVNNCAHAFGLLDAQRKLSMSNAGACLVSRHWRLKVMVLPYGCTTTLACSYSGWLTCTLWWRHADPRVSPQHGLWQLLQRVQHMKTAKGCLCDFELWWRSLSAAW